MVIDLLDVNLLVSLAWPNHVHHRAALRWFHARSGQSWATTPFTETAFVRISANPAAVTNAVAPAQALDLLVRLCAMTGHRFLSDDLHLGGWIDLSRLVGHRQVTDAHLLAVARRHGARLATFDRGLVAMGEARDFVLVPF